MPQFDGHSTSWELIGRGPGICLLARGAGEPVLLLPGMEGDGSSCVDVATAVQEKLASTHPLRLVLVDYSRERHATLAALQTAVLDAMGTVPSLGAPVVWGQSFGCLLAAGVAKAIDARGVVFVSPFTRLPRSRMAAASTLRFTPRPLYRLTNGPVSRWVFGPVGSARNHEFFRSLSASDPRDVARRTAWLGDGDLSELFKGQKSPRCAWFGTYDRLIDLRSQVSEFSWILSPEAFIRMIPGSGHVVLPDSAVEFLSDGVAAWLSTSLSRPGAD